MENFMKNLKNIYFGFKIYKIQEYIDLRDMRKGEKI